MKNKNPYRFALPLRFGKVIMTAEPPGFFSSFQQRKTATSTDHSHSLSVVVEMTEEQEQQQRQQLFLFSLQIALEILSPSDRASCYATLRKACCRLQQGDCN